MFTGSQKTLGVLSSTIFMIKQIVNTSIKRPNFLLLLQGVTKRMKISRRVVGNDGSIRKEEKVLTINVKPGSRKH